MGRTAWLFHRTQCLSLPRSTSETLRGDPSEWWPALRRVFLGWGFSQPPKQEASGLGGNEKPWEGLVCSLCLRDLAARWADTGSSTLLVGKAVSEARLISSVHFPLQGWPQAEIQGGSGVQNLGGHALLYEGAQPQVPLKWPYKSASQAHGPNSLVPSGTPTTGYPEGLDSSKRKCLIFSRFHPPPSVVWTLLLLR